jgi:predicted phosphodiesterase
MAHARLRAAEVVFCGHTHHTLQAEEDGVRYFNTGCWTGDAPTYITVGDGGVQVHTYSSNPGAEANPDPLIALQPVARP